MGQARIRGTLAYFKCTTWGNLVRRCVNTGKRISPSSEGYRRKGIELRMTKEEWYAFCDSEEANIRELYDSGQTPSIDRIDPSKHYQLDNVRIITFTENRRLSQTPENTANRTRKATKAKEKKVFVKTKEFEATFLSIKDFMIFFNLSVKTAHNLVNQKSAAGKLTNFLIVKKLAKENLKRA